MRILEAFLAIGMVGQASVAHAQDLSDLFAGHDWAMRQVEALLHPTVLIVASPMGGVTMQEFASAVACEVGGQAAVRISAQGNKRLLGKAQTTFTCVPKE